MAVSISGTSGTWSHGNTVTISGGDFGTKTSGPPLAWDNCSGSVITDIWSGAWPIEGPTEYRMAYRAAQRGVAFPHSRLTQYMCGCHGGTTPLGGYDVIFWHSRTFTTKPYYAYYSMYFRADPAWVFGLGVPNDENFKIHLFETNAEPYSGSDTVTFAINGISAGSGGQYTTGGVLNNPDQNGHSAWWEGATHPMFNWVKIEYEVRFTGATDGFYRVRENGRLVINYLGQTDWFAGTTRCHGLGGYARGYGNSNQWRYFADMYMDTTLQRVILGNSSSLASCTIREVQPPITWANNSIQVTVNLGQFTTGTAYLFVYDAIGDSNPTGYPITVNGGSPVIIPVSAFTSSVSGGQAPLSMSFTDQSTNNPTAWSWAFGANSTPSTSIVQNPSTTYSAGGAKTVSLSAGNSAGTDPTPATAVIAARYLKPTNFQAN